MRIVKGFFLFILFLEGLGLRKLNNRVQFATNQFATTRYMATNKIMHVYFSHMTYLMSHVTSLNNTCGWSCKLSRSGM
jgi:hypothetical protein